MLVFAKQKTEFLKAALELAKDNRLDPGYMKAVVTPRSICVH